MKLDITMRYILMFSYELRKNDWQLYEHDHHITAHNIYKDIKIVIPKKLDKVNTIDVWCSGILLFSFSTITMLDMQLEGLFKCKQ